MSNQENIKDQIKNAEAVLSEAIKYGGASEEGKTRLEKVRDIMVDLMKKVHDYGNFVSSSENLTNRVLLEEVYNELAWRVSSLDSRVTLLLNSKHVATNFDNSVIVIKEEPMPVAVSNQNSAGSDDSVICLGPRTESIIEIFDDPPNEPADNTGVGIPSNELNGATANINAVNETSTAIVSSEASANILSAISEVAPVPQGNPVIMTKTNVQSSLSSNIATSSDNVPSNIAVNLAKNIADLSKPLARDLLKYVSATNTGQVFGATGQVFGATGQVFGATGQVYGATGQPVVMLKDVGAHQYVIAQTGFNPVSTSTPIVAAGSQRVLVSKQRYAIIPSNDTNKIKLARVLDSNNAATSKPSCSSTTTITNNIPVNRSSVAALGNTGATKVTVIQNKLQIKVPNNSNLNILRVNPTEQPGTSTGTQQLLLHKNDKVTPIINKLPVKAYRKAPSATAKKQTNLNKKKENTVVESNSAAANASNPASGNQQLLLHKNDKVKPIINKLPAKPDSKPSTSTSDKQTNLNKKEESVVKSNAAAADASNPSSKPTDISLPDCPICLNTVTDVSSTSCGHIFCHSCIAQVLKVHLKCPICNRKVGRNGFHRIYLDHH